MDDHVPKRRRIVVDDDEEGDRESRAGSDDLDSNPDAALDDFEAEDEEEGEDLNENWLDDYAPAPELDNYDAKVLVADDDPALIESYEKRVRDRLAAEEELDAMDIRRRERDLQSEYNLERVNRFEQQELDEIDEEEEEEEEEDDLAAGAEKHLNLEAFDCPLTEWIAEDRTRREIQRRFRKFLSAYYPKIEEVTRWLKKHEHLTPVPPLPPYLRVQPPVYPPKIREMCSRNASSLEISYGHLGEMQSLLAIWLTDVPREMLQIFDEVLQTAVHAEFPHYDLVTRELHVRIINLPLSDKLRDLRQGDLNNLIKVTGVVTRRGLVHPVLKYARYDCSDCGARVGPIRVSANGGSETRPARCMACSAPNTLKLNQGGSQYSNFQMLTLQESPGSVPAGRVPRYKQVVLLDDLVDVARPGEEIEVTGIYCHSQKSAMRDKSGCPVFSTVIEANCVQKSSDDACHELSEEDRRRIKELSADPQISERIIRSIAPSIFGHRHAKTAIALALFGGCRKEGGAASMHKVRGDINVLLLGDPGTAKSQILKYSEKIAARAIYTTGKGASAVGLTAGVRRDHELKEWTLEGGALVLADQGSCLIDEFDKMSEQDRTSIHEAMEQQTISVSKAGIVATLQARCSVIAAANPIGGRYDPTFNLAENVELTDPILQRFDILCVLRDVVDPLVDEKLADFVVCSHMRSHPDSQNRGSSDPLAETEGEGGRGLEEMKSGERGGDNIDNNNNNHTNNNNSSDGQGEEGEESSDGPKALDQATLRKYIAFARANVRPILHDLDSEKIASLYAELRTQSAISGGVPIAVRHIESVMRMAEASAKMHLRDHVREDDIDMAIKVMLESFLQAQKISVRKTLQRSFRKYITYGEESNQLLMHQLQGLMLDAEKYKMITKNASRATEVFLADMEAKARELNIYDLRPFFRSRLFRSHNMLVDETRGMIVKEYNF